MSEAGLIRFGGPAGWIVGGVKALFDLFGSHKSAKFIRARTFDPSTRAANAAQRQTKKQSPGWGGEESKTRQPTRPRDVDQSRRVLDELDRVSELAIEEARARQRKEVEDAKAKARKAEEARRQQTEREQEQQRARSRRDVRPLASGSHIADLLSLVGTELVLDIHERKLARDQRRARLRTNRRGALAQRPVQSISNTNRTGAAASQRSASSAAPGNRSRQQPQRSPTANPITRTGQTTGPSTAERSASDQRARDILTQSPSMPSATSSSASSSSSFAQLSGLAPLGVAALLGSSPRSGAARASAQTLLSAMNPSTSALTGINSASVGSSSLGQSSASCRCPKPKSQSKSKKPRSPSCSNPLISRTEKDGIITIKRELKCPPSKPKSLSL